MEGSKEKGVREGGRMEGKEREGEGGREIFSYMTPVPTIFSAEFSL